MREAAIDLKMLEPLLDPAVFSEAVLGFRPFGYQKKLLRDESKRICACMGRQTGKSTTVSAKSVHFAVVNPRSTVLVVSATLRQSMLMFDKILAFVGANPLVRSYVAYRSRTRLRLKNGSWIIALPCGRTGATLRGFSAQLVVVDEASFVPEGVITNVVMPMLSTTDGYCWMVSTPYDRGHVFYRAFNDLSWSVYRMPSSANPLISGKFLEEQRLLIGEVNYRQEYEAEFVDDAGAYFPMSLLRACVDPELSEVYELKPAPGAAYAGYDPGGRQDPAALVVVAKKGRSWEARYVKTWMGQDYTTIDHEVADLCRKMDVERLCVDQTGLGSPILEHLQEIYHRERLEGVTLTQRSKEELMLNLKLLLEQQLIRVPNNRELLASLSCITYERTYSGSYHFEHAQGTHDDIAHALALAVWSARRNAPGVVITV